MKNLAALWRSKAAEIDPLGADLHTADALTGFALGLLESAEILELGVDLPVAELLEALTERATLHAKTAGAPRNAKSYRAKQARAEALRTAAEELQAMWLAQSSSVH